MPYEFLSDEWIDAVDALRNEAPDPPAAVKDVVINLEVTECPFGERQAHITGGLIERGFAEGAPTKLTVPYDVAKELFVSGNPQAAMEAFMSGKIRIEGDMSKLMAMQTAGMAPTPEQLAFQKKLQGLTA
jgi:putative sterol carrier protein